MDDRRRTGMRPDSGEPAPGDADTGAHPASGTARQPGQPEEAASGGAVDATLRGDPGTPHAMGLGNEPAPDVDDPETDLDAVERPD